MNADISLRLFEIAQEFIADKAVAREFVSKIEQTIEKKFEEKKDILATKEDISRLDNRITESKAEMIKWMFIFWIGQLAGTIGIILLFVKR